MILRLVVAPAQAGAQFDARAAEERTWIPAFAGMTQPFPIARPCGWRVLGRMRHLTAASDHGIAAALSRRQLSRYAFATAALSRSTTTFSALWRCAAMVKL